MEVDDNQTDEQTQQNEPVEETTEVESSPTETEAPEAEETESTEEAPAESEEDTPEPEAKTPRKGKGLERRNRQLINQNRNLQEQLSGSYNPLPPTPAQAGQALGQIDSYVQQTGNLPEEISVDDYQHLLAIRDGQAQAQADVGQAKLERELAEVKRKQEVSDRINQVSEDIHSVVSEHSMLNPQSEAYDQEFDDTVSEGLEDALKENPRLNVKKFLANQAKIYDRVRSRAGSTAAAGVAKQAATSALTPRGAASKGAKSDKDKSTAELEAEIVKEHGVFY